VGGAEEDPDSWLSRNEKYEGKNGLPLDIAVKNLLPTPMRGDGERGSDTYCRGNPTLKGAARECAVDWGKFEPAIRRWETILGRPAPAPTEPGQGGKPRLSVELPEWMLGLPEGWVTAVPGLNRQDKLRILGNGVQVQSAVLALRILIELPEPAPVAGLLVVTFVTRESVSTLIVRDARLKPPVRGHLAYRDILASADAAFT